MICGVTLHGEKKRKKKSANLCVPSCSRTVLTLSNQLSPPNPWRLFCVIIKRLAQCFATYQLPPSSAIENGAQSMAYATFWESGNRDQSSA